MSEDVIEIQDKKTGSFAQISPRYGMNCFRFSAMIDNQLTEALWSVANFEQGEGRPSGNGIPILFPYPGRIKEAHFTWQGKRYQLDEADGAGNAIHGFVHTRPWRVIDQDENSVTAEFQASQDDPTILEKWPADFIIRVKYELKENQLLGTYTVINPDEQDLPFGLGTHAYFKVPLSTESEADACQILMPYTFGWEFAGLMANGKQTPRAEDPTTPILFQDANFDNAFGGLVYEEGRCVTSIMDPQAGRKLTQIFTDDFKAVVMYNPPHREAFCIEPYTYVPDPYRLEEAGIESGLRVLKPEESFETTVTIQIEKV